MSLESRPPDEEGNIGLTGVILAVSIMDVIMFEAQRQGRLSFYMVKLTRQLTLTTPIQLLTQILYVLGLRRRGGYYSRLGRRIDRR